MQRPVPEIKEPTDVLIEVDAVGICGTDLRILDLPRRHPAAENVILRHEFAGRIEAVGSAVHGLREGDHIVADPNVPCGTCRSCRGGYPNACQVAQNSPVPGYVNTFGIFRDGGMTRFTVMPGADVYKVASHVPAAHAVLGEPLAVALNGLNKVGLRPEDTVVVLGAGPIGLLFLSVAKVAGARVIASEPLALRRKAARTCGADVTVDPAREDLEEVVMAETGGSGADVVVEAVGHLLDLCVRLARFGGRILVLGDDATARPAVPQAWLMRRELQIVGAFLPKFTMNDAVRMLEQGSLPMEQIVTHQLPLGGVHEGMELLREGKAIKVVLRPTMD